MIVSHLLLILHKKIQFYIFMFEAWNVAKGRKVQGGWILSQGTVYTKNIKETQLLLCNKLKSANGLIWNGQTSLKTFWIRQSALRRGCFTVLLQILQLRTKIYIGEEDKDWEIGNVLNKREWSANYVHMYANNFHTSSKLRLPCKKRNA